MYTTKIRTHLPEPASELYWPSNLRLSQKLVPTFADRGCHVVIVTDPYGRIIGFLDWRC
jgi:CBS-domain-containing membrane protein